MATKLFVNLPVKNLNKSIEFFTKLGFKFDKRFTDEKATCMIINEDSYVMLITEKFFKTFTKKEIADSSETTETIISISTDSRKKVDELADKAIKAGGKRYRDTEDMDWMYTKSFLDPDNHNWEIFYMDLKKLPVAEKSESR